MDEVPVEDVLVRWINDAPPDGRADLIALLRMIALGLRFPAGMAAALDRAAIRLEGGGNG